MRAILLASATATSRAGFFARSALIQAVRADALVRAKRMTAVAPTNSKLRRYYDLLSPDETERSARFKHDLHRRRFATPLFAGRRAADGRQRRPTSALPLLRATCGRRTAQSAGLTAWNSIR